MRRRWTLALGVLFCTAGAMLALRPAPGRGEPAPAADVRIEWKDTWEASYEANRDRWKKELADGVSDSARRDRELAERLLTLVRALVDRYPDGGENRAADYQRVAKDFASLAGDGRGVYLRRLVADLPGQTGLAVAALDALLDRFSADALRENAEASEPAEFASGRLIALAESGYVPAGHPAVERAWRARAAIRMAQRRYWDAQKALERLEAVTGRTPGWLFLRAELLLAAGRPDDALPVFEQIDSVNLKYNVESRIRNILRVKDPAPDFPRDLGLEMKWGAVHSRAGGSDTAAVQALLDESAAGQGIMPATDGSRAATWVLLDRLLADQEPEVLARLRQAQQRSAEETLAGARRSALPQAIFAAYRRYPWATNVHQAMAASAEEMLRRGWSGLAVRTFEDVLTHATDDAVRAKARVGLALAILNETRDADAVKAAFAGVSPETPLPWMGGSLPASAVRKRLLDGLSPPGAAPAPAPADPALRLMRLPPVTPWDLAAFIRVPEEVLREFPSPLGSLVAVDDRVLAGGPRLVALFGDDLARPLWWRTLNDVEMRTRRSREADGRGGGREAMARPAPGPCRPAMADGRVYSRWGLDPAGECLRGVAAFDARTGEMLWSTDDDPAWQEMWPASDPVPADGRVYVLAIQEKLGPVVPVHLVCLDGARGTVIWQRMLGLQGPLLSGIEGQPSRRERPVEMVRYGCPVTVHRGAVYAVTNLGLVARCDARDGMVEWVATYQRARAGSNWAAILRRQGAAPLVIGDRVVCLPRDYQGLFALDRASGRTVWDAPLLPAEEAVGCAGAALLVKGDGHVLAVDAATGRVAWDREFAEGIVSRPVLACGAVYVPTPAGLVRLDAATGAAVDEKPWPGGEAPSGLAVQGGSLLAVSPASAGAEASRPPAPLPPLAVPVKEAWRLARPDADLWVPPAEAKAAGRLYLGSRGTIECIEMCSGGRVLWQRFAIPPAGEPLWAEGTLILTYADRAAAIDAATGARKWQAEFPWRVGAWKVFPPYLVAAYRSSGESADQPVAVADLATGRLLWAGEVQSGHRRFTLIDIGWDGKNLHLLGGAWDAGEARGIDVVVRASDGEPVAKRPLPPTEDTRLRAVAFSGPTAFVLTYNKTLYEFSLADGKAARREANLGDLDLRGNVSVQVAGPWLRVCDGGFGGAVRRQWILRVDDPHHQLALDRGGEIRDGVLYSLLEGRLVACDLRTGKETAYEVPTMPAGAESARLPLDVRRLGDRLWVLSRQIGGRDVGPGGLRVDVFDAAAGAHLAGQVLPGVFGEPFRYRRAEGEEGDVRYGPPVGEVVWTSEAVYVTDGQGLHVLSAGPAAEIIDNNKYLVTQAPRPVAVDGAMADWDERGAAPLAGPRGRAGRVTVTHDAANLYLALRYQSPVFLPHVGDGDAAGGNWLELALATNRENRRWAVGADARGRVRYKSLDGAAVPAGLKAAVRHDVLTRELVYEMAIPWKDLVQQTADARRMGLSLAVWEDDPDRGGQARVLTWGDGLAGRQVIPAANQPMVLYAMTRQAVDAMLALAEEVPDLPEAFEYFKECSALRAESPEALLALYADFIRRRPQGMTAERLLALDRSLRVRGLKDPTKAIAEAAAKAGAPPAAVRRYQREAQAYLSQRIYMDAGGYPRSIVLELDDGIAPGQAGWNHRAYWVKPYWQWETPRPAVAMSDKFPADAWYEIRVPLVLVNMNEVPICGISFAQQGEPRLLWDRSAVVYDGKEEVFLAGAMPEGTAGGRWEWVADPARGAAKVHTHKSPEKRYDVEVHWVTDFVRPAVGHVRPPEDGAYLSQWVYLDPKDPPKTVSLGLHDGRQWRCELIWGAKNHHGRYVGPLPPAGAWQELRAPLAWTPLAAEPIYGLSFACDRGRVFWNRTAIVAAGKEQVLIEDAVPAPPRDPPPAVWQPWVDTHLGGTSPAPGKAGWALNCDGSSGYAEAPHSPALDPEELTVEAWVFFRGPPWGPDTRRWLVAKNGNEETDGHYGLMIKDAGVGAYLNVGGTRDDRFDAWSGQDVLAKEKWHHLAMTYDGKDLKVYLNGEEAGWTPVSRRRKAGEGPLYIGRRPDGYSYYFGPIDEVRLYNRALTADEVRARFKADGAAPTGDAAKAVAACWDFDDVTPLEPGAGWVWVDQPARAGKRSHTQAPAGRYAGHACVFKEPVLGHVSFDCAKALAALERAVPNLGTSDEAWRLLGRMVRLEPAPAALAARYRWFIQALPDHPQVVEAVKAFADACRELRAADAAIDPEAQVARLGLSADAMYAYNRKYVYYDRNYVRAWQLLGPFFDTEGKGRDAAFPPETEGVRLGAVYDGGAGKIGWKLHRTESEHVDLSDIFDPSDHAAAYAACWIRSETAQPVVFEIARDDSCKVWLNREVVADAPAKAALWETPFKARATLPAGWSEVLVRIDNVQGPWEFRFEVVDPMGRKLPAGIEVSPMPPPASQ